MRKLARTLAIASGLAAALALAPAARAADITLKAADVQSNTAYERGLQALAAKLEKATDGRVAMQVIAGTALGSELDLVKQVRQGTLDVAQVGLAGYNKFQLLYIPFLFDQDRLMDFTKSDIAQSWKDSLLKDWDVHLLAYVYFGPRHITANKPILAPDDLKGVKIRVPQFPTMVEAFQNWKANVVAMPVGELYVSLQTGTIDAQENPLNFIVGTSLFEVQKHLSLTSHVQAPRFLMIGAGSLARLQPKDQETLRRLAAEAAVDIEKELRASDSDYLATLKAKGMTIHEVDSRPFATLVKDVGRAEAEKTWGPGVLDRIRKEYGPKG